MDVYDFLNLATDLSGAVVSIFDCTTEKTVFDSSKKEDGYNGCFDVGDAEEFLDYEVDSYDLFTDVNNRPHLELNITMDDPND